MITLFDLSAEFWRNYFAFGENADSAYENTLESILYYRGRCERLAILCDGKNLLRCQWASDYKGNRPPKPQEAKDALQSIKEQAAEIGLPVVECEGYEADDLMATLVKQAWPDDVQLVCEDKDLYQVIDDNCWLINRRGIVNEQKCIEKFGVRPGQIRDLLALAGDTADNVKGCVGIGVGRARDLLVKFGTLDKIMAATDEEILEVRGVSEKTLANLRAWDPALAVRLVSLLYDAPVKLEELWPIAA